MFVPKYVTYLTVQATNGHVHAAVSLHQMGETDQPGGEQGGGWGSPKGPILGVSLIYSEGTPNLGRKHAVKHTKQIEKFGAVTTSIQSDSGVVRSTAVTRWVEVRILVEHFLPSPFALRRLIVNQILGCFGRFVS